MEDEGKRFLLLIPAYNEEERIEATLQRYVARLDQDAQGRYQIVVVLNGCRDLTLEIVQRVCDEHHSVSVLNFPERIGKGGALIRGLAAAPDVEWIGYVDADGATAPEEFLRLVALCRERDCVIGSRWLPGATLLRQQTLTRQFVSRVFHFIVQILFGLNVKDTQCPAKVFTRKAALAIQPKLKIADLAFDVNLLNALKREGFEIHEEPTEWTDQLGSKVTQTLFRSSLVMLLSVLRLRLYYSPVYPALRLLRPIEAWIYHKLRAPFIPWGEEPEN